MMNYYRKAVILVVLVLSLSHCAEGYTPSPVHTKITQNHFDRMEQLLHADNDSSYYLHHQYATPESTRQAHNRKATAYRAPQPPTDNDSSYFYNYKTPTDNRRPQPSRQYIPITDNDTIYTRPQRRVNQPPSTPIYPQDNDSYYKPIPKTQPAPVYPQDNDSAYTSTTNQTNDYNSYPQDNDSSYKLYFD